MHHMFLILLINLVTEGSSEPSIFFLPMKVYNYDNISSIVAYGNITNTDVIEDIVTKRISLDMDADRIQKKNVLYIICGCGGLVSFDEDSIMSDFISLDSFLNETNSYVHLIRGTEDNPILFKGYEFPHKRIVLTQDCSVIKTDDSVLLCVGGGFSYNRDWKERHEKLYGKKMLFDNEGVDINEKELIDEAQNLIDVTDVVTFSSPSFVGLSKDDVLEISHVNNNNELLMTSMGSRLALDRLYSTLLVTAPNLKNWFYVQKRDDSYGINLNSIEFTPLWKSPVIIANHANGTKKNANGDDEWDPMDGEDMDGEDYDVADFEF